MRILMLIAVVCFTIALLGELGAISGVGVVAWALGGWLAWAVDVALGGYTFPVPARRAQP